MGTAGWIELGQMDELGRMDTPVHRLDARAKAVVTLAFIATVVSFGRYEVSALTPFLLYPVFLLSWGHIPLRPIVRKLLVAAPFALLIGIFNPLIDRQPAAVVGSWVISGGWLSLASILLRFVLTVGAALALVACTGLYRLGAGLEQLGCPRVFVVQLLFLYRYLFVLVEEGSTVMRGVELRSGGHPVRLAVYGSLVGHLLLRSLGRAERVYRAMVARGFDGEIRMLQQAAFRLRDGVFVCGWLAYCAACRIWNPAEAMGRFLAGGLS